MMQIREKKREMLEEQNLTYRTQKIAITRVATNRVPSGYLVKK